MTTKFENKLLLRNTLKNRCESLISDIASRINNDDFSIASELCVDLKESLIKLNNSEDYLISSCSRDMITYAHGSDPKGQRFRQYRTDPIPTWAVDIKPENVVLIKQNKKRIMNMKKEEVLVTMLVRGKTLSTNIKLESDAIDKIYAFNFGLSDQILHKQLCDLLNSVRNSDECIRVAQEQ